MNTSDIYTPQILMNIYRAHRLGGFQSFWSHGSLAAVSRTDLHHHSELEHKQLSALMKNHFLIVLLAQEVNCNRDERMHGTHLFKMYVNVYKKNT